MPIIAKIEVQKKNAKRFNIYFLEDNQPHFAFGVSEDTLVRFNLKKGMELSDLELIEIQFDDIVSKAFAATVNYISYRIRSEKEIITYLKDHEYEQAVITEVLHKLKNYNYLDDLKFAQAYVRNEMNVSRKGPNLIRKGLYEKGITPALQEEALKEYPGEIELENAIKWANKTFAKQKGSAREAEQKTLQTLIQKGFTTEVAKSAIAETRQNIPDQEWQMLQAQAVKIHKRYQHLNDHAYKQNMKAFLYRKGYPIELINKLLDQGKEAIESGGTRNE